MSYDGGKGNTFRNYINLIPPHRTFVSGFLGGCSVMANKRLAEFNIGIDADADAIDLWRGRAGIQLHCGDFLAWLETAHVSPGWFFYLDPPYLFDVRASSLSMYNCEFGEVQQHEALLSAIENLPCMIMLCGYPSALYTERLRNWHMSSFTAHTRANRAVQECIWTNYEQPPPALHDYSWLGVDYRERERIKRKKQRWQRRLRSMSALERYAILAALEE